MTPEQRDRLSWLRLTATREADYDEPIDGRTLWTVIAPAVRAQNAAQLAKAKARRKPATPPPMRVTSPARLAVLITERSERAPHVRGFLFFLFLWAALGGLAALMTLSGS